MGVWCRDCNTALMDLLFFLVEMDPKDKATECYCLLAQSNQMHVSLGTYTISWKRSANSASKNLVSVVSFPPITAKFQTYTLSAG